MTNYKTKRFEFECVIDNMEMLLKSYRNAK